MLIYAFFYDFNAKQNQFNIFSSILICILNKSVYLCKHKIQKQQFLYRIILKFKYRII